MVSEFYFEVLLAKWFFPDFHGRLNYGRIYSFVKFFLVENFIIHFNHSFLRVLPLLHIQCVMPDIIS